MTAIVTGAGGQLGQALLEAFPQARGLTRADWDVTLPPPPGLEADLVLHAAAWTDVDGAEDDPQGAAAVNVGGVQHAASLGVPIVCWSSDYVFDGSKREPYLESDAPAPLSAYGRSKLHGEAAAGERAWIVRSSWLYGWSSRNFVLTMLRLGAEREEVAVVDDQRGCPTYVADLAEATKQILERPYGVYHLAAAGECTWAEFAEAIFEEAGLPTRVRRISSASLRRFRAAAGLLRPALGEGASGAAALARRASPVARSSTLTAMRVLVTGGAGFIGSHFVRRLAAAGEEVVVLDKLTYAGNRANLEGVEHSFVHGDIADPQAVERAAGGCDAIVNFAAETHVDRSILGPAEFILTDVLGTQVLLDHARRHRAPARAGLDRRGLRRHPARRSGGDRGDAGASLQPLLGLEGRRRHAGARIRPHLRRRRLHHALREHLRPAAVPREDAAPVHHELPRRRAAAGVRRREAAARVAARRRPLRGDRARAPRGNEAEASTTSAGRSARTWTSSGGSST